MTDKTSTAPVMSNIIEEWKIAGGSIHGPNVETVTMPLTRYAAFRSSLNAPTPDVVGDDVYPVTGRIYKRRYEWVMEITGTINETYFNVRHTEPESVKPEDVAGLPSRYPDVVGGDVVAWQRRDRISHGGGEPDGWSHWREVGRHEFDEHNGKHSHIQFRALQVAAPRVQGDADARRVAEALAENGWASGGDFEDDFLPDVRSAISVALAAQPKGDDYREIANLIGKIFFYGDFKAKTQNERTLEALLRKTGNFFDTEDELLAAQLRDGEPHPAEQTRGDGVDDDELLQDASDVYMAYVGEDDALPSTDGLAAALEYIRRHAAPRQAVPDGWVVLPKNADRNMHVSFMNGMAWTNMANSACTASDIDHLYGALIAAAPSAGRMGVE